MYGYSRKYAGVFVQYMGYTMERAEAERLISKAKSFVDKINQGGYVEVEELNGGVPSDEQVIPVEGGHFVRAFVFVPSIP